MSPGSSKDGQNANSLLQFPEWASVRFCEGNDNAHRNSNIQMSRKSDKPETTLHIHHVAQCTYHRLVFRMAYDIHEFTLTVSKLTRIRNVNKGWNTYLTIRAITAEAELVPGAAQLRLRKRSFCELDGGVLCSTCGVSWNRCR